MNDERFDQLARSFASGLSRRRVLKGVLAGGLLTLFGRGARGETAVAAPNAPQPTFLPIVMGDGACSVASVCGQRQDCDRANNCICIRSAEGDIRCGKLPSCSAKLCETSADCAELGEGYFCDTPNSGCCTNPPKELQRCIAPCKAPTPTPTCPTERVCGTTCCPEGQRCLNGACCATSSVCGSTCCPAGEQCVGGACCPTGRACGTTCCPAGQTCDNGACKTDCAFDIATSDSLDAARAALAAGADEVALSPGGCLRYTRTRANGITTTEEMRFSGTLLMAWAHQEQTSTMQQYNRAGTLIHTREITRGPAFTDQRQQFVVYAPATGKPTERFTYTRTNATTLHVVRELADAEGTFAPWVEFDIPVPGAQPGLAPQTASTPLATAGTCSASDEAIIKTKLKEAFDRGVPCLEAQGRMDAADTLKHFYGKGIIIECDDSLSTAAQADWGGWFSSPPTPDRSGDVRIIVRTSSIASGNVDARLLFHEMMHFHFGEHDADYQDKAPVESFDRIDRTEACAQMCFGGAFTDRCHCARCLETSVCDEKCKPYKECSKPEIGAVCRCPSRRMWYNTRVECEQDCPKGLKCFGFNRCDSVDLSCPPGAMASVQQY